MVRDLHALAFTCGVRSLIHAIIYANNSTIRDFRRKLFVASCRKGGR